MVESISWSTIKDSGEGEKVTQCEVFILTLMKETKIASEGMHLFLCKHSSKGVGLRVGRMLVKEVFGNEGANTGSWACSGKMER